jgi:hypothetical protein
MGSEARAGGEGAPDRLLERASVAALLALGALLVWRTWMTWILPSQDVSREVSLPWRVSLGERLYRDISYPHGPLATWLHAAAFRLLGPHLHTPLFLLLPSAALAFGSLLALGRRVSPWAALAGTALTLTTSLASPLGGAALVYPYGFNAAHALAFGAAGLVLVTRAPAGLAAARTLLAGLLWAAALGCKLELGLAAVVAGLVATIRWPDLRARAALSAVVATLGGAAIYAVALAGVRLPEREGPFVFFGLPEEWRRLYRWVAGLSDPLASLGAMAAGAGLAMLLYGALELLLRAVPGRNGLLPGALLVLAGAAFLTLTGPGQALDRELPVLLRAAPLVVALLAARAFLAKEAPPFVALLAFGAFVSTRVFLNFTYGNLATPYASLAAPALLLGLVVAAARSPLGRRPALALLLLGLGSTQALRIWTLGDPSRWKEVATARGTFRLRPDQAVAVAGTLDYLGPRVRSGELLAGFPEVGLYRFLLDLRNPLREEDVLPGSLTPAAEAAAVAVLETRRPRFVLVQNQPFPAYGAVAFGVDYATGLGRALDRGWRLAARFGYGPVDQPIGPGPFFVRVYDRREGPP